MKVSYNWLKEYVENMPPVEQVLEALTMHSFEVESVEDEGDDKILDIKILPNRSHDCLSHYGIASEIASVCELKRKPLLAPIEIKKKGKIKFSIDTNFCSRAVGIHMSGLKIGESSDWLKAKLKILGQRPINSVVDISNYLMYAFGQPTHAFDASKIIRDWRGNIALTVRMAKDGEKLTLLNDKVCELPETVMVIADKNGALDVAGVMGGKASRVTEETTDIILTLCNFNAVQIRKQAKMLGVRTDASQRFENEISPALIDRVLPYALKLISEIAGGEVVAQVDEYSKKQKQTVIEVTAEKISSILGVSIDTGKIVSLLARQDILAEVKGEKILATAPLVRLDLTLPEDIAEEVGRLYGYENISPVSLPENHVVTLNPVTYISTVVQNILKENGFSEIFTYAFVSEGDVELENPLASDKKFLRKDLSSAMSASLEHNFKFLDLLGLKEVKLFELGKVFTKHGEFLHLALGVKYPKSTKSHVADEEITKAIRAIEEVLGFSIGNVSVVGGMAEIDCDRILNGAKIPETYPADFWKLDSNVFYKPISPYPFAVRDVAVFVPSTVSVEQVTNLVKQHLSNIVVRFSLFDTFIKTTETGSKTSYAFRLVFQSPEKTLTDDDINAVMNPIYETLKSQENFEIR